MVRHKNDQLDTSVNRWSGNSPSSHHGCLKSSMLARRVGRPRRRSAAASSWARLVLPAAVYPSTAIRRRPGDSWAMDAASSSMSFVRAGETDAGTGCLHDDTDSNCGTENADSTAPPSHINPRPQAATSTAYRLRSAYAGGPPYVRWPRSQSGVERDRLVLLSREGLDPKRSTRVHPPARDARQDRKSCGGPLTHSYAGAPHPRSHGAEPPVTRSRRCPTWCARPLEPLTCHPESRLLT